jgi:hypothetical protein
LTDVGDVRSTSGRPRGSGRRWSTRVAIVFGLGFSGALALAILATGSALWSTRETTEPQGPRVSVGASEAHDSAQAAVDAFVPILGADRGFVRLVAQALVEADRNRVGDRAAVTRHELAAIRHDLGEAGLPDVMVGIPYVESRLRTNVVSPSCAAGPWQFLPEVAVSEGLHVRSCTLAGSDEPFTPGRRLPPRSDRPYLGSGGCRIRSCAVDERLDLERSTAAAVDYLGGLMDEPSIASNPARIPLAIMAYNAGPTGVANLLKATAPPNGDTSGADPFGVVPDCTSGDCLVLTNEAAWYVPRVVAAAAIAACNGADPADVEVSDWSRSAMCSQLNRVGMAPPPVSGADVLAATAGARKHGWTVGLATIDIAGYGLEAERHRLDAALLAALGGVPGVQVVPGVPGEDADSLFEQGADVVVTGEVGVRGDLVWLRLERWSDADTRTGGTFVLLDHAVTPSVEEAGELLADALSRPVRDHQADAILALVDSQSDALAPCVPPGEDGEAFAQVSLRVDEHGRPSTVAVGPDDIDVWTQACVEQRVSSLVFPTELAGAGATLDLGIEAPVVADASDD